ncbi:MAG: DUF4440 domain-containing protein [Ignavibacteriae bacterium HGW-Ignavibacteriae-3]|nr:MAG: DUF4440 domain-containing protein [Ignavibacteriae bacterium HGW-Ignavibacteriae-3]
MKYFFLLTFFIAASVVNAQRLSAEDRAEILRVLENQRICWNYGDLAGYMEGYWKSDSTLFIGKSGIKHGWEATFESYKKGYPDKESMGILTFKVISLEPMNDTTVFMIGKWDLERNDKVGGYFSLIWKKIHGKWVVTADHSS